MVTELRPRARQGSKRRWLTVAGVGLVAALTSALVPIGGAVLASGPTATAAPGTTSTTIKACFKTSTSLSVMNHLPTKKACPTGDTTLTWNRLGRQGPAGPQGPAGVSVGVSGTSATPIVLTKAQTLVPVLSTAAVPDAGTYYVSASVMLVVASGDTVACILEGPSGPVGAYAAVGPVAGVSFQTLALAQALPLTAGTQAAVYCAGYAGNSQTEFYDGGITATLITSATGGAPARGPSTEPALPPKVQP